MKDSSKNRFDRYHRFGRFPQSQGLFDPKNERDSCGVGFVVNINGIKSHDLLSQAVKVLANLMHRGATGGDMTTGDGSGILMQISDGFFRDECKKNGINLPGSSKYGIGMIFMPQYKEYQEKCRFIMKKIVESEKMELLGWRTVPVNNSAISVGDAGTGS